MSQKLAVVHVMSTKHVLAVSSRSDTTPGASAKELVGSAGLLLRDRGFTTAATAPPDPESTFTVRVEYQGKPQLDVVQLDWTAERDKLFQKPLAFVIGKTPEGDATENALDSTTALVPTVDLKAPSCGIESTVTIGPDQKRNVWVQVQVLASEQPDSFPVVLTGELKPPAAAGKFTTVLNINPPLPPGEYTVLALVEGLTPAVTVKTIP